MINPELLDTILLEWSYRLKDGIPDVNDSEKINVLNEILAEMELPLFEAGRDTELASEGLIIYFATLDNNKFDATLEFLYDKNKNKKLESKHKLPITSIDPLYYGQAAKTVVEYINKYNSNDIDYHVFLNAISSAKAMRTHLGGKLPIGSVDRGELYTKIRNKATSLAKAAGLTGIVDDKWCPADIMVYGKGIDSSLINSLNLLNTESEKEKSINGLFIDRFEMPGPEKILGISLKQQEARGGKAKSFTSVLKRDVNYPDASKLNDKFIFYMDIAVFLNTILDPKNDAKRTKRKSDEALKLLKRSSKIIDTVDPEVKKSLSSLIPKLSSANLKSSDVEPLYKNIYNECETEYTSIKNDFITSLGDENYEVKQTKEGKITGIETFLKKASCYLVALDLITGFDGDLFKLPDAIKSISTQTNPFVALTAYAIGYAGISPTFYKLIGSESTNIGKFVKFPGDGVLQLPKESKVTIQDNPEYKGFVAIFTTDVISDEKKSHSYQITLAFKFSEIVISVEVTDIKEK
jgi:hypothetical protein